MSADYTYILFETHHFGDSRNAFTGSFIFAGSQKDFEFSCPDVEPLGAAVLILNTFEVNSGRNIIQINGVDLKPTIPKGQGKAWVTHQLLVPVDCALQDTGNTLHVEARDNTGGTGNIDDFLLDNVVIMFHADSSAVSRG